MPESHDPLRALFKEAADGGRSRARSAPVAVIAARGRARRVRRSAVAAAACVVLASAGLTAAEALSGGAHSSAPAGPPGPAISPSRSPRGLPTTPGGTGAPTAQSTSPTAPSTSGGPPGSGRSASAGHGTPTYPPATGPASTTYPPVSTSPPPATP